MSGIGTIDLIISFILGGATGGLVSYMILLQWKSGIDTRNREHNILRFRDTSVFFDYVGYDSENNRYELFLQGNRVGLVEDQDYDDFGKIKFELEELMKKEAGSE